MSVVKINGKPYLFNVPQKHPRGRYACYLMENDIFPKVRV